MEILFTLLKSRLVRVDPLVLLDATRGNERLHWTSLCETPRLLQHDESTSVSIQVVGGLTAVHAGRMSLPLLFARLRLLRLLLQVLAPDPFNAHSSIMFINNSHQSFETCCFSLELVRETH